MTSGIHPITDDERRARMENARRLMRENKIGAILLEGDSSMFYFTGTRWGRSERTFGMVFPADGEPAWVVPGFEEARAREVIRFGADIRTWQEDESPYRRIAQILNCLLYTSLEYDARFIEAVKEGRAAARRGDLLEHDEVVERVEKLLRS